MAIVDYDEGSTAERYLADVNTQPVRTHVEDYSLMKIIGDVNGKKVLDVACGDGHYTRLLRRAGAAEVVGIDISERMIDLGREEESRNPLGGIEYRVEDAMVIGQPDFDLVTSLWLFPHATTRAELTQMCQGQASRLKPGGRLVAMAVNPGLADFDEAPDYREYGFALAPPDRFVDGVPFVFTFLVDGSNMEFELRYFSTDAFESGFAEAGLTGFALHQLEVSPTAGDEPGYWNDFLSRPHCAIMDGLKRSS